MLKRIFYGVAALSFVAALIGLHRANVAVAHYAVALPNGAPAIVYEPGPPRGFAVPPPDDASYPVVVLYHGFSSNKSSMSVLARRLTRAGYAVITPDFRGHGANPQPFSPNRNAIPLGLVDDVEAAVFYARAQRHFDAERIVVSGHSMGGHATLGFSTLDPGVAAVIGISGGAFRPGPYPPPNVLLVWGSGDPSRVKRALGANAAGIADLERLVAGKTYGELSRGRGIRLVEIDGADHFTVIYSEATAAAILDWLGSVFPEMKPPAETPSDGRMIWCLLGVLASGVLIWAMIPGLAGLASRDALPPLDHLGQRVLVLLGALVVAVLIFLGLDLNSSRGPLSFVPIELGRETFLFFSLVGTTMLAFPITRSRIRFSGLLSRQSIVSALILFFVISVTVGLFIAPFFNVWPQPWRLAVCLLGTVWVMPYFAATEWLYRGQGVSGIALPLIAKGLTLGVMLLASGFEILPRVLAMGAAVIAPGFLFMEIFAHRISRKIPDPWIAVWLQALLVGFMFGAVGPMTG